VARRQSQSLRSCARDKMETAVEERDAGSVRPEGAAPLVDLQPVGTAPGDESPTGAAPATEASAGEAVASLRRRSSVAVVSLQRKESASGLPGRLAEQLRHTVVALGLSLLVPPLLLLTEGLVGLFSQALPNVRPSAPCGRLLMDENSTSCVIALVVGLTFFHCGMGLVLVGPKRTAPHTLIGATAHALFLVWYSSLGQVGTLAHFLLCFSGSGLHIFVVTFSVKLKRRWRRAPRALKESVTFMALGVFFCVAATFVRLIVWSVSFGLLGR
jgi:hypothetical protein